MPRRVVTGTPTAGPRTAGYAAVRQRPTSSGHGLLPHTADLTVTAWAPTREECLTEAVDGLVASFADIVHAPAERTVPFTCPPASDSELLVRLLEDVIYLLDAEDTVPVHTVVEQTADGGLAGHFGVVRLATVEPVGPAPKAVTRHNLRFQSEDGAWRCAVTIDV